MLGSASPIYELVSGQLRLGKQAAFAKAHQEILVPILQDTGIEPVSMLVTEAGSYGRFLNIYRYLNLDKYGQQTDAFAHDQRVADYFAELLDCIEGPLQVDLAIELFPHPIMPANP
ncbi:MAG: NIPSNAP family protein [Cyanobacteria bacterium P01_A01_bin.114]